MKLIAAILALLPSLALAQPLPQPKPAGGGSCPHGYTSSGSFCVPRGGRPGRGPVAAERHLPARLDPQRQLLLAQRQRALIHRVTPRSAVTLRVTVERGDFFAGGRFLDAFHQNDKP